jgi:short-subunit dehydrogenase
MNTPYCASKFGVVGLTKSIRREGAAFGVKASVVCPGAVQTPILDNTPLLNADRAKLEAKFKGKIRTVDPPDAARMILRGVARNRAIIIFPFAARFLWWLYRLHPSLSAFRENMLVREMRAVRIEPEG